MLTMDGREAAQGLTLAELGGLNINNNSSNNDDDASSQGSGALMRAGDEKVAESLQGLGAPMRAGEEKVAESLQGLGSPMRAGEEEDAARNSALDVIGTAVTYPNDVRGEVGMDMGVEVGEQKAAPAAVAAAVVASPPVTATAAVVAHTTGEDSVQGAGAWGVVLFVTVMLVIVAATSLLTRFAHPLIPPRYTLIRTSRTPSQYILSCTHSVMYTLSMNASSQIGGLERKKNSAWTRPTLTTKSYAYLRCDEKVI